MKVKDLKRYLEGIDDDVQITLVEFDYSHGTLEHYLNVACSQYVDDKLRFTKGINVDFDNI